MMVHALKYRDEDHMIRVLPTVSTGAATGAPPASCLVVDDDTFDRCLVRRCLGKDRRDLETFEVGSLAAARAFIARQRPDLVLLDHRLPDGLGADYARELRADPTMRNALICVVTSADPRLLDADVPALSKDKLTPQGLRGMVDGFLARRNLSQASEAGRLVADFGDELQDSMAGALSRMLRVLRRVRTTTGGGMPESAKNDLAQLEAMLLTFSEVAGHRH